LTRFTGFGALLIQRYVGRHFKPWDSSPQRRQHGGQLEDSSGL
jgi:hypothetical protein